MSDLWRKQLERLQTRFFQLGETGERVGSLLVEVSPEWYEFRPPPGLRMRQTDGGCGWKYRENPCEHRSGHGEEVRETRRLDAIPGPPLRTYHDAVGTPILNSNGQPVALDPGLARYHFVYGDIPTANKILDLARAAGAVLPGVPLPPRLFSPRALFSRDDDLRWFYALHEIARKGFRGTSLRATRMAYNTAIDGPQTTIQMNHPNAISLVRARWTSAINVEIADPPTHTFTELPDLVEASVSAIDVLLELGADARSVVAGASPAAAPPLASVGAAAPVSRTAGAGAADLLGAKERCAMLGWEETNYKQLDKIIELAKKAGVLLDSVKEKGKGNRWLVPRAQWEIVCALVSAAGNGSRSAKRTPRQTVASLDRQVRAMPIYWCDQCRDHFRSTDQPPRCPHHPTARVREEHGGREIPRK